MWQGFKYWCQRILDAIGTDKRINKNFLKVGGPFAGPCLPRDNQAVLNYCKKKSSKWISKAN